MVEQETLEANTVNIRQENFETEGNKERLELAVIGSSTVMIKENSGEVEVKENEDIPKAEQKAKKERRFRLDKIKLNLGCQQNCTDKACSLRKVHRNKEDCKCETIFQHCEICYKHTCPPCSTVNKGENICTEGDCSAEEEIERMNIINIGIMSELKRSNSIGSQFRQRGQSETTGKCRSRDCETCRETCESATRDILDYCKPCIKKKSGEPTGTRGCLKRRECCTKKITKDTINKRKCENSPPLKNPSKRPQGKGEDEGGEDNSQQN